MKKISPMMITQMAVIIAMDIVLTRVLVIQTASMRISFGFIAIAICAVLYGPVWAGVIAAFSDVLGMLILNRGGMFFPGITLTTALVGVVLGVFLYKRNTGLVRTTIAAAINCLLISAFIQTFWLSILNGTPYWAEFVKRLPFVFMMFAVQTATLPFAVKLAGLIDKYGKRARSV